MTEPGRAVEPVYTVSDFVGLVNQTLEYAYPVVTIEGEVSSFKVNQGKWVFFDLKDAESSVGCFMSLYQLRVQVEDGMKVVVRAAPRLTRWGKFSLTVQSIRPSGEGSLKRSFELLYKKLTQEGLFAAERKRLLPQMPERIAVVSSTDAAGYKDFIKIIDNRWGGMTVEVAHVQVQGESAPDQMVRAIEHFNSQPELAEVLVLVRGGGSADDLASYNDEKLVRAIAASRIPTLVGVGHEVDETLADMAADVRAATPSNAAEILVPDGKVLLISQHNQIKRIVKSISRAIEAVELGQHQATLDVAKLAGDRVDQQLELFRAKRRALASYDPRLVLERGYAIVRGAIEVGAVIGIENVDKLIKAEVRSVSQK